MNLTFFLALFLVTICSAEPSEIGGPFLTILESEDGCKSGQLLRTLSCGCFVTQFAAPTDAVIQERCVVVTGITTAESASACQPFLIENDTNYDFAGIFDSVVNVYNRCFAGSISVGKGNDPRLPQNFPFLRRTEQLYVLSAGLVRIFGIPTISVPPLTDRMINFKSHTKATLFKRFNQL